MNIQISAGNGQRYAHPFVRLLGAAVMLATTAVPPEADAVGPALFGAPTNFPVGSFPGAMVAADFNSDGAPDIAVTAGGLSVLLGNGSGAIAASTNYPLSMFGNGALATGDFNKDGKADLLEADWYNTRIILGDGAGNLSLLTNYSGDNNFSVYPNAAAVGDLNGDGNADIAIANMGNPSGRGVTVGFGAGNGFFGARTNYALPHTPGDLVLGDVNGDGTLDAAVSLHIFTAGNLNSVCILTNRGNGTLAVSRYYDGSITDSHYGVRLADFNGAGGLDLAVLSYNHQSVAIRLNDGSGEFGSATNYPLGFQPTGVATGDFNGDEEIDLIIRGSTIARVLLGHGDGSFTLELPMSVASGGTIPGALAVGDFDINGSPDLTFANYNHNTVTFRLNQRPPSLAITPMPGSNQIRWLAAFGTEFALECTTNLLAPGSWQWFPTPPVLMGGQKIVTDVSDGECKFYRLRKW